MEQISVRVQILHIYSVDSGCRELLCRSESLLHNTAVLDIFKLGSYERSALSWLYMLELDDLEYVSFDFHCNTVSKIAR